MIYADSSALLKLVIQESESRALEEWLAQRFGTPLISSELGKVEVVRAIRRIDPAALPVARAVLRGLDLVPLTSDVIDTAADVGHARLRTLDAIHLASALSINVESLAFLAYDHRLVDAAAEAGLDPASPGA